ncbi:MAG: cysteine desulfurase family protein [Capsulimonadales bacterium]|nr:cysteine desulfurase family protein [Capsulimonadales bacterium]
MTERTIYLDYAATTPVDPEVLNAMLPFLGDRFGNPSSVHRMGQEARRAVDQSRDTIAAAINADSSEIFFTSGGTEADNAALFGVLRAGVARGRTHLVTTAIEHHAVLDAAMRLARTVPFTVSLLPVDQEGFVSPEAARAAINERTALVSVMHANNEIGTIQDIRSLAEMAHAFGAYFHTDAVQTFGQMPIDVEGLGIDLMTLSAHKIYGPKGIGALYARQGVDWHPFHLGGQQEREKRAGTENVPGIVGFGKATELMRGWRDREAQRLGELRDRFVRDVTEGIPGSRLNGPTTRRLPNNANFSFTRTDGETLLLALDMAGIAASSGSACASGSIEPSHVLAALGLEESMVRSAVRFSLGRQTVADDLAITADVLKRILRGR